MIFFYVLLPIRSMALTKCMNRSFQSRLYPPTDNAHGDTQTQRHARALQTAQDILARRHTITITGIRVVSSEWNGCTAQKWRHTNEEPSSTEHVTTRHQSEKVH